MKYHGFKTLIFTDDRAVRLGQFAHIIGNAELAGSSEPKLQPKTATMEQMKAYFYDVDFTGTALVNATLELKER